jgi:DNA replication protein DnaC
MQERLQFGAAAPAQSCPRCQRGIAARKVEDGVYMQDFCDCNAGRRARYRLDARLLAYTLDGYPGDERALKLAQTWLDGDARSLLIQGEIGVGKTGLAVSLYKQAVDRMIARWGTFVFISIRPRQAQFWRVADLLDAHKETFNNPDLFDPLPGATACAFLALDDLGSEEKTEYNLAAVQQLIQRRYNAAARTIITTNLDKDELATHLGQRTMDRIGDAGEVIILTGGSLRGKPKVTRLQVKPRISMGGI